MGNFATYYCYLSWTLENVPWVTNMKNIKNKSLKT